MSESEKYKINFISAMKNYLNSIKKQKDDEFYEYSCVIQHQPDGSFIHCNELLTLGVAQFKYPGISEKYQKLLEFVKSLNVIVDITRATSLYDGGWLAKMNSIGLVARDVLEEIGEA